MRRPAGIEALFKAFGEQPFTSQEDAERWLQAAMTQYNSAGQADMGGLSPDQMSRLLSCDWGSGSVGSIATDLEYAEVGGSAWLQSSRALLSALNEAGPVPMTGDLKRDADRWDPIGEAVAEAVGDRGTHGMTLYAGPDTPEGMILGDTLGLLLASGLVKKLPQGLGASRRGSLLLTAAAAGELYRILLTAWLRDLDVADLYEAPEAYEPLIDTLPYTVYRLQAEGSRWRRASWLAQRVVAPEVLQSGELGLYSAGELSVPLGMLVLQPLAQFDLLESRSAPRARIPEYRSRPLLARAIRFAW